MRRPRAKVDGDAYYHVMSRCALQTYLLQDEGGEVKEMFMTILRRAEAFSGVKILNYCIMDNHFHILVFVPKRREVSEELLRERIITLYGQKKAERIFDQWDQLIEDGDKITPEREKAAFRKRMYDISEFMRTFKQRFSMWYRSNHANIEGTIWQGAFHSVLVEGKHDALGTISTYISLNPVRAGMVDDAADYQWSGYGAASKGDKAAKEALLSGYRGNASLEEKWHAYQGMIAAAMIEKVDGEKELKASVERKKGNKKEMKDTGKKEAGKNEAEDKAKLLKMRGIEATKKRERRISRGLAFGSRSFVESVIRESWKKSGMNRSMPLPYCLGDKDKPLFFANRHTA